MVRSPTGAAETTSASSPATVVRLPISPSQVKVSRAAEHRGPPDQRRQGCRGPPRVLQNNDFWNTFFGIPFWNTFRKSPGSPDGLADSRTPLRNRVQAGALSHYRSRVRVSKVSLSVPWLRPHSPLGRGRRARDLPYGPFQVSMARQRGFLRW